MISHSIFVYDFKIEIHLQHVIFEVPNTCIGNTVRSCLYNVIEIEIKIVSDRNIN